MTGEEAWEGLVTGRLGLHEVPSAAAGLYDLGYRDGMAVAQNEIDREKAAADRYYERWLNPGTQLATRRLDRIDAALTGADVAGELRTDADAVRVAIAAAAPPRRTAA